MIKEHIKDFSRQEIYYGDKKANVSAKMTKIKNFVIKYFFTIASYQFFKKLFEFYKSLLIFSGKIFSTF